MTNISVALSNESVLARTAQTLADAKFAVSLVQGAALDLVGKLKTPPPPERLTRTQVYGQPFQSDKQRRFFFAALKEGSIAVPYTRESSPQSQRMLAGWSVRQADAGLTAIITNSANRYNEYVMGDAQSVFMYALGWQTAREIVTQEWPGILRAAQAQLAQSLQAKS